MIPSKKTFFDKELNKVIDELSPVLRAMAASGYYGNQVHGYGQPLQSHQQSLEQLRLFLLHCQYMAEFYCALGNIYEEKIQKLNQQSSFSLPS
jgi:hypothetical protein